MRTNIPEKLIKIAEIIEKDGQAALTCLTVLKKWFEKRDRLPAFAVFVAKNACSLKGKTSDEAAEYFRDAEMLLSDASLLNPLIARDEAEKLYFRLKGFQTEHKKISWNRVRILKNKNLYLLEEALGAYLWPGHSPSAGYRLAVSYCEHYDPRFGNSLNGPSLTKINEIVRFIYSVEAQEGD